MTVTWLRERRGGAGAAFIRVSERLLADEVAAHIEKLGGKPVPTKPGATSLTF
jgi:hypothetical protein